MALEGGDGLFLEAGETGGGRGFGGLVREGQDLAGFDMLYI
jgi:hypothetical protein